MAAPGTSALADAQAGAASGPVLLDVDGLEIAFAGDDGEVRVIDGVGFTIRAGETLAVVGESGCGKSVTALAVMRLLATPPARVLAGRIRFEDVDLLALPEREMRRRRGCDLAMIFQEPMTSLNPAFTIGDQITETILCHHAIGRRAARLRALEMLRRVGMPAAERRLDEYPHQLSGGMRQRVMIAMALVNAPRLLIADEPTTALDVTIQAQILRLMRDLQAETGTALMLITHDLGVVAEAADHVAVMYAGSIVERGPVDAIFDDPQHPYTIGLMSAIPSVATPTDRLATISGSVPPPGALPPGCRFADRCPFAVPRCAAPPPLRALAPGHEVRCWRAPIEDAVEARS